MKDMIEIDTYTEDEYVSMETIIHHLCDELEFIQKDIYSLSHHSDFDTSSNLKQLLDHFEKVDASLYKLKELNGTLKKLI